MAAGRGQSLAQMALAWLLRDDRVTSVLIGASSVAQLDANLAAVDRLGFDADELARIDEHAVDAGINLWARSSDAARVGRVEELRAQRVVDALRERGVDARMEKAGVYQFGISVRVPGGAPPSGTATAPPGSRRR